MDFLRGVSCYSVKCGNKSLELKDPSAKQETRVRSLGREDPLKKGMAAHSSILAWRIPWTEEPGGYSLWCHQKIGQDLVTKQQQQQEKLSGRSALSPAPAPEQSLEQSLPNLPGEQNQHPVLLLLF